MSILITSRSGSSATLTPVNAQTVSYTLTSSDYTVTFDTTGGSVTATLPTAVGVSGKSYIIKKIDSSTNSVIIATTSSQTIDGNASSALALYTQYEALTIESDGANWLILDHRCDTSWATYVPITQGIGTGTMNQSQWRRVGDSVDLQIRITAGTPTANTIQIGLPNSWAINTSGASINHLVGYATRSNVGTDFARQFSVIAIQGNSYLNLGIMQTSGTSDPLSPVLGSTILVAADPIVFFARVPVVGWFA